MDLITTILPIAIPAIVAFVISYILAVSVKGAIKIIIPVAIIILIVGGLIGYVTSTNVVETAKVLTSLLSVANELMKSFGISGVSLTITGISALAGGLIGFWKG